MKLKILFLSAVFLALGQVTAQSVIEITYLDVPATKINRFIELHKQVTDLSMDESRTIKGHWLFRHWYGSGASIVMYDQYDSAEDAVKDNLRQVFLANIEKLSEDEKTEINAVYKEWWSFFKGHWDEMRVINYENYFTSKEDVDWDTPYVFIVGDYNTNGSVAQFAKAYMEWQIIPGVKEGAMLSGGASAHYKGTGSDAQFMASYSTIIDFATAISNQGSANAEARTTFWNMVEGDHKDQIYVHMGHLKDGKFDRAGKE